MMRDSPPAAAAATAAKYKHTDKTFSSGLLDLTVSFRWRARIDDKFIDTFRHWIIADHRSTPDLVVMGESIVYFCFCR